MPTQEPGEYLSELTAKAQVAHQQAFQRSSGVREQQPENSIDPEPLKQSEQSDIPVAYAALVRFQNEAGFLITEMVIQMRDKDDEIRRLQRRVEELELALMNQKEFSDGDRKSAESVRSRPMLSQSRR